MSTLKPEEVLTFWIDEVGPKGWYDSSEALDARVRDRFLEAWQEAAEGSSGLWLTYPEGALAYIILTDQFPRNMFRDDPRAFSTDRSARAAAKVALDRDWDLKVEGAARQFFYLPLMHSENLIDQDRAVRLFCSRMPDSPSSLVHARAHREIIRRFGRFPYRNAALGRKSNEAEQRFMDEGGYGALVREMSQTART
ncbi:hypothetical protein OG2516_04356 [Oceanicola granulosus HTCC2516]|uniref:DUF924 domain-containing protein n=1 Tax=Oceanicola granulosus (strain ATCC BAA-861 / DSM 15982 / KCTC 12143 / HTCC2516) TaxID=314256 RepID=Q2CD35_OCEGH|nr:DUF924 family protein [Oceanicola granulosus]EAR50541.1 hypothetical protein OG2516_04356 [Oceanicola granulosus HTCC2516]